MKNWEDEMDNNYSLHNYTETLVDGGIKHLWSKTEGICKCERCFYDTKALALNHLPAKYVLTISGEAYAKVDGMMNQSQVDVMSAVTKASLIVTQSYSHPGDEIILTNPEKWD